MIGSAPKPTRRDDEAQASATILPFRLRVSHAAGLSGKPAPLVEINGKTATPSLKKRKTKATSVTASDRPTILPPRYREWIKQAIIGAVLLHFVVFAMLHFQFIRDVERAANSGGAQTSDGTMVLDIDIVADAKLPPSKTPTNMTAPDATKQTNTVPQEKQEQKQKEAPKAETAPNNAPQFALPKEELAAPKKSETASTAQSPNQEKREEQPTEQQAIQKQKVQEQKKKQEQAAPSIAASPNRAASQQNKQQNNAGANGVQTTGGQAETSSYSAQVLAHLQRFRVYPDQARSSGVTGVSTVRFTLGAGGNVLGVSLAASSGSGVLDQAALAMVHRASPFPPIPPSLGRGSMSFAAPVRFNLR